ncbi:hypothetical protein SAMN03097699_0190 [Flavobacteriaceae bacterium MAR_2010_188]|nr:hypothetical protein SAMN03097699_0190 [Flavobacteriaceae bacterium MAR_2010_188]
MASGFFALLDDIAAIMDDVAVMSKITTKKTAGILGDDLAVNAEKASGFVASRELPVLWAITKGSMLNKIIILPVAFLLSAFLPWAVTVILILGGIYLAYEGAEKIYEYLVPHKEHHVKNITKELSPEQIVELEKEKIKSAIITDFILSVEIVIIALGTVIEEPLLNQILVVSIVAIIATIGVYGIVALIVRMDDFGHKLIKLNKRDNSISDIIGNFFVKSLPWVIRGLGFVGTIALLLVAGGIFSHNLEFLHHFLETWPSFLKDFLIGLVVGFIAVFLMMAIKKILPKKSKKVEA